jgi:hypothetical protein
MFLLILNSDVCEKGKGLESKVEKPLVGFSGRIISSKEFPVKIGQISGLAIDSNDTLVLFHRSTRRWAFKLATYGPSKTLVFSLNLTVLKKAHFQKTTSSTLCSMASSQMTASPT